jgi:hypothetical protein
LETSRRFYFLTADGTDYADGTVPFLVPWSLFATKFVSMLHEEITKDVIGAAMAILNELRPGLDEKLYENALVIELQSRGTSLNNNANIRSSTVVIS